MFTSAVEKFHEYKGIFTPNYQKVYLDPEDSKDFTISDKVFLAWFNVSQFMVSMHCISSKRLGLMQYSINYSEEYGIARASLAGRLMHLGSLSCLVAAIAKGTWPIRYTMITVSIVLIAGKLLSNWCYSDFKLFGKYTNVRDIFNSVPDGNLSYEDGEVLIFRHLHEINVYRRYNNLELWNNLLNTADVNQMFKGRTLLTSNMDDDYYKALLSHKPNVRQKIYIKEKMREYLPLEWAILTKRESIVELLLEHNNAKDYSEKELKGMLRSENSDNLNHLLMDAIAKKRSNFRLNYTHTDFSSLKEASIVKKALYCWVNFSQFLISNSALSNKLLSMYSYRRFITSESSFTVNTVPPVWKRLAHATSVYAVGCLFLLQNNGWVKTVTAGTLAAMAFTKLISNRVFLNDTVKPSNIDEIKRKDPSAIEFSETVRNPNV